MNTLFYQQLCKNQDDYVKAIIPTQQKWGPSLPGSSPTGGVVSVPSSRWKGELTVSLQIAHYNRSYPKIQGGLELTLHLQWLATLGVRRLTQPNHIKAVAAILQVMILLVEMAGCVKYSCLCLVDSVA
jgi:hypothetical protein